MTGSIRFKSRAAADPALRDERIRMASEGNPFTHPLDVLRNHVTGAIERGEAEPVIEWPIAPRDEAPANELYDGGDE